MPCSFSETLSVCADAEVTAAEAAVIHKKLINAHLVILCIT